VPESYSDDFEHHPNCDFVRFSVASKGKIGLNTSSANLYVPIKANRSAHIWTSPPDPPGTTLLPDPMAITYS
jgi:hypothetical protein